MTPKRKAIIAVLIWLAWLTAPAAAATMGSIGKELINVRSGPGLKCPVAFQAELGYPLLLDKTRDKWISVQDWKGRSGWVYRRLVSDIHTVIVLADSASVRVEPDIKSRVAAYASKGEIYKVAASRNQWVKIAYYQDNESVGWVYQKLVWGARTGGK
jgi:SH3-like domain-containing protein